MVGQDLEGHGVGVRVSLGLLVPQFVAEVVRQDVADEVHSKPAFGQSPLEGLGRELKPIVPKDDVKFGARPTGLDVLSRMHRRC